ncbi:MAG: Ubiquinone/menaquinone biosynthesis C-methyltransferase UbiE [Fimbriimonadaceae bacterium]|nr:Ubiquinone/menaquinone biosynthesis C-methyltransferase UbiE [Fimbriimonadaceae bacterium]
MDAGTQAKGVAMVLSESADPSLDQLIEALDAAARTTNDEWLSRLNQRKLEEIRFHDADRERLQHATTLEENESTSSNRKFYSVTKNQRDYVNDWLLSHTNGKVFLDYACGEGHAACQCAKVAKLAIGLDISSTSIELSKTNARRLGVDDKTYFLQGDCENTGLPDNSIDVVLCSGMLHHLDLSYAFPELRRILKPGGKILAVEALDYNPLIKAYRKLTPGLRTEWEKEHILSLADVKFARRFFDVSEIRYWNLFNLFATPFRRTRAFDGILSVLDKVDNYMLKVPGIAQMAWSFTFVLNKRNEQ